ncbi:ubiquilin-2 [Drosophila tropicalis]|uniref:ubiquilin-2 n=1 Tax=Drosophila tropicalis TaxID=46794 RepID=UPI0035ABB743
MNCLNTINIKAKGSGREAIVSLRQNELIRNFRALVAVRFELAIDRIVLVFGGHVLWDVGSIDHHGITSGVTVHVVCRQLPVPSNKVLNFGKLYEGERKSRNSAYFKQMLDNPNILRESLQSDPRIGRIIEENASFRHYLSSDRNLREVISLSFSPARQELGRRRDLYIFRMESIPGGHKMLDRLNNHMREIYENSVAMSYQQLSQSSSSKTNNENPQRGRENNEPLPNPWLSQPRPMTDMEMNIRTLQYLPQHIKSQWQSSAGLARGHLSSDETLEEREQQQQDENQLEEERQQEPEPSTSKGTSTLNMIDFLSCNETRCEQRYQSQLHELCQMGYSDRKRNICALLISQGDVRSATKLLDHWNR